MNQHILGTLILVVPALALAWVALWRRNRAVFWFALVLIVVAAGYLNVTGATRDVAGRFMPASAATGVPAAGSAR